MKNNISIIGGDLRIIELAKLLSKERNIVVYGLEKAEELHKIKEITFAKSLPKALQDADVIIGPIPFSPDGESIFSPFSDSNIKVSEFIKLSKDKKIIAGSISATLKEKAIDLEIIDLMENEELTVLNTIATAEGTVQVAMEKSQSTIQGTNILILGFGRVGKTVAGKFSSLLANVTCAARKKDDFAWIEVYGYKYIDINYLEKYLSNYDIIINTVPQKILTKERLKLLKENTLVIDLASKPGGVDRNAIKEFNISFDWALALPGKVAPLTSAKYINRIIKEI